MNINNCFTIQTQKMTTKNFKRKRKSFSLWQIVKLTLSFVMLIFLIQSCNVKAKWECERILNHTNQIEIVFKDANQSVKLNEKEIEVFKEILRRDIKTNSQKEFTPDIELRLMNDDEKIGEILVKENRDQPHVNFCSTELNFGFQLNYQIGRFLAEMRSSKVDYTILYNK